MATNYNLHLKGYVGGEDFDRDFVDYILEKNSGKPVNVLIDSLGGSLATGLSISSAFRNHGNVSVHYVGMNASAATIASLGASHISIDANAMYLVHKCSTAFFKWGSLNADQFNDLIANCDKIKADLDKLDLNVASMYARKCKKPTNLLLDLMKEGAWLSAKEAHDWGFVDEITDFEEEKAPVLTDAVVSAMATQGLPIPKIPITHLEKESGLTRFVAALTELFKPKNTPAMTEPIQNTQSPAAASDETEALRKQLNEHKASLDSKTKELADRDKRISDLEAEIKALKETPGASTSNVVASPEADNAPKEKTEAELYCETFNSASKLFSEV